MPLSMLSQPQDGDAAVKVLIQQMLRKEKQYSAGILENNDHAKSMAMTLAHSGVLDEVLDSDKLQEYRNSLKELAEQNVQHERQVHAYIQALQHLQQTPGSGDLDYSKVLKEAMSNAHDEIQQNSVEAHQERMYLEVCESLNEPKAGQDRDDEEIAVMETGGTRANLKCPLTGVYMTDPYKNKVCNHVYEKDAILQHLRTDKRRRCCPVAGCVVQGITMEQLVPDPTTLAAIRRQKNREERQREILMASQNTIDMDEE